MTAKENTQPDTPLEEHWFTEAPTSWNVKYLMNGFDCMLTLRANEADTLIKRSISALDWLIERGAEGTRVSAPTLSSPASAPPPAVQQPAGPPEPVYVPDQQGAPQAPAEPEEIVDVSTISHAVTRNGKPYLLVKGGKFSKYGVKAWPETVPETWKNFTEWQIGQEFTATNVQAAVVGSKVVRFIT